jgi:CRP/FNR family transcriptional regulator, cyclic AMP receptor protein
MPRFRRLADISSVPQTGTLAAVANAFQTGNFSRFGLKPIWNLACTGHCASSRGSSQTFRTLPEMLSTRPGISTRTEHAWEQWNVSAADVALEIITLSREPSVAIPPVPVGPTADRLDALRVWSFAAPAHTGSRVGSPDQQPFAVELSTEPVDALYLFMRHLEWERYGDPGAAWDLIAAAQSSDDETRAHARSLLARSFPPRCKEKTPSLDCRRKTSLEEDRMKVPYGLEIVESCPACCCKASQFFCSLSESVLQSVEDVSHRSTVPAGAILFVEGQTPRGVFIVCSGRVKLSTTSREGKMLVLKTAESGEALGLSAAISGQMYEVTAETASPCRLNFIDRKSMLSLLHTHTEIGWHAAQSLSRDFQAAYRDIHDLVLSRSSAGKLARLLLSCSPDQIPNSAEVRLRSPMTHEEMAQRIGSSRETVTRLLSDLRRKKLIRSEGATLVIRSRSALEALAV